MEKGSTEWLIDEEWALTAGHRMTRGRTTILEFQAPQSTHQD